MLQMLTVNHEIGNVEANVNYNRYVDIEDEGSLWVRHTQGEGLHEHGNYGDYYEEVEGGEKTHRDPPSAHMEATEDQEAHQQGGEVPEVHDGCQPDPSDGGDYEQANNDQSMNEEA